MGLFELDGRDSFWLVPVERAARGAGIMSEEASSACMHACGVCVCVCVRACDHFFSISLAIRRERTPYDNNVVVFEPQTPQALKKSSTFDGFSTGQKLGCVEMQLTFLYDDC